MTVRLPDKQKIKFYQRLHSIHVAWRCFSNAIERGEDYVLEEQWEKKRGPKGKSLEDLTKEYAALKPEHQELQKELQSTNDPKIFQKLAAIESKMFRISDRMEKDYDVQPF